MPLDDHRLASIFIKSVMEISLQIYLLTKIALFVEYTLLSPKAARGREAGYIGLPRSQGVDWAQIKKISVTEVYVVNVLIIQGGTPCFPRT